MASPSSRAGRARTEVSSPAYSAADADNVGRGTARRGNGANGEELEKIQEGEVSQGDETHIDHDLNSDSTTGAVEEEEGVSLLQRPRGRQQSGNLLLQISASNLPRIPGQLPLTHSHSHTLTHSHTH